MSFLLWLLGKKNVDLLRSHEQCRMRTLKQLSTYVLFIDRNISIRRTTEEKKRNLKNTDPKTRRSGRGKERASKGLR